MRSNVSADRASKKPRNRPSWLGDPLCCAASAHVKREGEIGWAYKVRPVSSLAIICVCVGDSVSECG